MSKEEKKHSNFQYFQIKDSLYSLYFQKICLHTVYTISNEMKFEVILVES